MRQGLVAVAAWLALCLLLLLPPGCKRDRPVLVERGAAPAPTAGFVADCLHALCADNFFVDVAPAPGCSAGAACTLRLTLVATGDFHVNDEYPYRFKADEVAGVTFSGTDDAGKNVFSKAAGDWTKVDPKSGAMTVRFTPASRGPATIAGVLKLSVCSGATCQLEQSRLSANLAVN